MGRPLSMPWRAPPRSSKALRASLNRSRWYFSSCRSRFAFGWPKKSPSANMCDMSSAIFRISFCSILFCFFCAAVRGFPAIGPIPCSGLKECSEMMCGLPSGPIVSVSSKPIAPPCGGIIMPGSSGIEMPPPPPPPFSKSPRLMDPPMGMMISSSPFPPRPPCPCGAGAFALPPARAPCGMTISIANTVSIATLGAERRSCRPIIL
mmetsp:Transcript_66273/g.138133  ORF Transcript_66273/g.138133 Transcript_66273/m.138133 type:complete len:206 (-) Transcript_66273:121-738(-)